MFYAGLPDFFVIHNHICSELLHCSLQIIKLIHCASLADHLTLLGKPGELSYGKKGHITESRIIIWLRLLPAGLLYLLRFRIQQPDLLQET